MRRVDLERKRGTSRFDGTLGGGFVRAATGVLRLKPAIVSRPRPSSSADVSDPS